MARAIVFVLSLGTLALVSGCADLPVDGALRCGPDAAHPCPDGFDCLEGQCYRHGHGPDLSVATEGDMAQSIGVPDGGASPDLLPACGASGEPCCASSMCGAGLACYNATCASADVWAIGNGSNTVLSNHWNGNTWSSQNFITPSGLLSPVVTRLWGSSDSDIWGVGWAEPQGPPSDQPDVPAVYHWNGNAWTFCPTGNACAVPSSTQLTDIFGLAADDIWVTAFDGAYHWNGSIWKAQSTGLTTGVSALASIWCQSTNDCFIVGNNQSQDIVIQHWNGTTWSMSNYAAAGGTLEGVWGFASNDVWAVGSNGANGVNVIHWDGTIWSTTYVIPNSGPMSAVWGAASNDVWTVGASGNIAHWNGSGWTGTALTNTINCYAVYGFSSKDVWIAASNTMLHWDGNTWTSTMAAGTGADMRSLWGPKP